MTLTHDAWMQTHAGLAFDLLTPTPAMVRPGDVAHALARVNRFGGHTTRPLSVAQHSLIVAEIMASGLGVANPTLLLQGLVHDAPEAYVGDLPSPLKALLPEYQEIEARVWRACAPRFHVPEALDEAVKQADRLACRAEAHAFLQAAPLDDWAGPDPTPHLPAAVVELLEAIRPAHEWAYRWLRTLNALEDAVGGGSVQAPLMRWVGL